MVNGQSAATNYIEFRSYGLSECYATGGNANHCYFVGYVDDVEIVDIVIDDDDLIERLLPGQSITTWANPT